MSLPANPAWQEPWEPIDDQAVAAGLCSQLKREVGPKHRLYGSAAKAVARRVDCDDVLFLLEGDETPFAVVHLTWRSSEEPDPQWPWTELFRNWDDLQEHRLMPDRGEYMGLGEES